MAEETHTLVASSVTRGRFALDEQDGAELSSGHLISIYVGGQWIEGRVEHEMECYPGQMLTSLFEKPAGPAVIGGYYFLARDGGSCGLCIGMKIKLR